MSPPKSPQTVSVIRRVTFSSAHFFHLPHLSDAENVRRFGPTSNRHGHGHNYELFVTVTGPCEPETGMVVNLKDLKEILQQEVIAPFDFNNLNMQIDYFKNRLPTMENFILLIWHRVAPRLKSMGLVLTHLKLAEADDFFAEYSGENWEALKPA